MRSCTLPPEENTIDTLVLKSYLKALSVGLLNVATLDQVKIVVYNEMDLCADNYYHIYYDSLIQKMSDEHEEIVASMNQSIKEYFRYEEDKDYIGEMYEYFNQFDKPYRPHIVIPHYKQLQEAGLLYPYNPQLGWYFFERDYPLNCINCEDTLITKDQAHAAVTWFVTLAPQPYYFVNGDPWINIANCTAKTPSVGSVPPPCQVCPPGSTLGNVPDNGAFGGTANYELMIEVKATDQSGDLDGCLTVTPSPPPVNGLGNGNYAMLSRVEGFDYFKIITYSGVEERIKKVIHPIIDFEHYEIIPGSLYLPLEGDRLSLCQWPVTGFESYRIPAGGGPQQLARFTNAFGFYAIHRPIPGMKPLYFAFPYSQGLWYNASPDMTVAYNNLIDPLVNTCPPAGNRDTKIEDFNVHDCYFCTGASSVFGYSPTDVTKYIASTNYTEISSFWNDNVITIGLKLYTGANAANNWYDFNALSTPSTSCTSVPTGLTALQTFSLNSAGEYDVQKEVKFNNQAIPAGTTLYLQVKANFTNGEFIDDIKCVTVNNNSISVAIIQLRGNIKNYSSSVNNYEVKILKQ